MDFSIALQYGTYMMLFWLGILGMIWGPWFVKVLIFD